RLNNFFLNDSKMSFIQPYPSHLDISTPTTLIILTPSSSNTRQDMMTIPPCFPRCNDTVSRFFRILYKLALSATTRKRGFPDARREKNSRERDDDSSRLSVL